MAQQAEPPLLVLSRYEENVSGRPAQPVKTPRPKRSN